MFADLKSLEPMIKVDMSKGANWQLGPKCFYPVADGLKIRTFNISSAWFEQGHKVIQMVGKWSMVLTQEIDQTTPPQGVS